MRRFVVNFYVLKVNKFSSDDKKSDRYFNAELCYSTIITVCFEFWKMAERQGFEPWMGYKPMPVFKTGAFNRSAISPAFCSFALMRFIS